MLKFKVRFNLHKQEKEWQVYHNGCVHFYKPEEVRLVMQNCRLVNKPRVAQKIFAGEAKQLCAWIECERVDIWFGLSNASGEPLYYNPRIAPYWRDAEQNNVDGEVVPTIVTNGTNLIVWRE